MGNWVVMFYPEGIASTLSLTRRKKGAMPKTVALFHQIIYLINALTSDSFDESPSIQICLTHLAIVCSSSGSSPYLKLPDYVSHGVPSVNGPCPRTRHPPGLLLLVGRRQTPFRRLDEYRRIRRQASPHETALPPASHHIHHQSFHY